MKYWKMMLITFGSGLIKGFFEISMSEVFIDKPKTYTIPSNSLLWAMPINDVEIGSSNGAIQQNRYE